MTPERLAPERVAKFESLVLRSEGCWKWLGSLDSNGYGTFWSGGSGGQGAHRFAWRLWRGPIPKGMYVLHRCDVRGCVNPWHLYLGTARDNILDALSRGRAKMPTNRAYGEQHGSSKLTAAEAREIRRRAMAGEKHRTLAREFGISYSTVGSIRRREIWRAENSIRAANEAEEGT